MIEKVRWVLKWTYTDMDGRVHFKQREIDCWDEDPQVAYQRKVDANQYLMGGATITDVRLYRVDYTETWTEVLS